MSSSSKSKTIKEGFDIVEVARGIIVTHEFVPVCFEGFDHTEGYVFLVFCFGFWFGDWLHNVGRKNTPFKDVFLLALTVGC
jgi:hypothetical protein